MSTVPAEIAGVGSTAQKLRVSPGFDPLKANVDPDEYFLLSRIDGKQSLREILLSIGLPIERGIAIVIRLRSIGALLLPNETSAPVARASSQPTTPPRAITPPTATQTITPPRATVPTMVGRPASGTGSASSPRPVTPRAATSGEGARLELAHELRLSNATPEELAALAEDVEIGDTDRRRILAIERLIHGTDHFAILGVPIGADARTLKRAYFLLSKDVHPDRYYGRRLGSFAERLARVFEATSRAYGRLTQTEKAPSAAPRSATREQPQTPQEYAAELFDRACQLEVEGDAIGAMKLFAAAVRVDPQTRYLRRATSCALAANQPRTAVEYAKKAQIQAPNDVSSARLLAAAFRAAGKLSDAEEVLVMAMALKSENDVLTSELRNDLAEVRRMLTSP